MKPVLWPAPLALLLLLAACGGLPPRTADTDTTAGEPAATIPARPPGIVQKRGGAYYKDDGPGDDIPDNLDNIPEARPRVEPLHRFANNPYVVLGKAYVPATRLKPFRQRGVASWYGKKFHGQKTSIGEPYDMFSMTAAHPTLAIPSYVRVTRVSNGKSVVLRVTDRGPFHADRVIDLSYAAAYRLGYVNDGSTLVEVEAILPGEASVLTYADIKPQVPPAGAPSVGGEPDEIERLAAALAANETPALSSLPVAMAQPSVAKGIFLQLGAFSSADNAESLRIHLAREMDWLGGAIQISASGGMHRVHLGPYATRGEAEKVAERIALALGYKPAFVTR